MYDVVMMQGLCLHLLDYEHDDMVV